MTIKLLTKLGFVIVAFFGLCSFAAGQPATQKPKQWIYVADGEPMSFRIVITQSKTGYRVSGEATGDVPCEITGTYYPTSGKIKGNCKTPLGNSFPLDAIKIENGKTLSISFRGASYTGKPPEDTSPKVNGGLQCGVGKQWDESESGFSSIWTLASENSDLSTSASSFYFTAVYTAPDGRTETTRNRATLDKENISIERLSSTDKTLCTYKGLVSGALITGTYSCPGAWPGKRPWTAHITKCF